MWESELYVGIMSALANDVVPDARAPGRGEAGVLNGTLQSLPVGTTYRGRRVYRSNAIYTRLRAEAPLSKSKRTMNTWPTEIAMINSV